MFRFLDLCTDKIIKYIRLAKTHCNILQCVTKSSFKDRMVVVVLYLYSTNGNLKFYLVLFSLNRRKNFKLYDG
jgi:hypothetical protein